MGSLAEIAKCNLLYYSCEKGKNQSGGRVADAAEQVVANPISTSGNGASENEKESKSRINS